MHTVETVLLVLLLGALTGIVARYIRAIPLPLIQIALGALIAWPQKGLHIEFDPELFLLLFIPPLLFADGWRIPKREFFALGKPILLLALGLVLFTVLGLGYLIHWMLPGMPLTVAFALAAVVSPTDAVAVSAITRNLGMPEGGLGIGALLGWGFSYARSTITRSLGDVAATQMVLLLVLLPFAAYIVGEKIGVSGILAAVAAGIATNFADLERSSYISERLQTEGTWSMVEAAFNGAIFLLLGLQLPAIIGVPLHNAGADWWVLAAYVFVLSTGLLLLRWIWLNIGVQGSLLRMHRLGKIADKPSQLMILATTMAGIRGAVTLAGALSVPLLLNDGTPLPERGMLIFLATGTILFTLIAGSISLPLILRRLPPSPESPKLREERLARENACLAAIASITLSEEDIETHSPEWVAMHQEVVGHVTQEYRHRIQILDDGSGTVSTLEAQAEAPDAVAQRKHRYVVEIETRLRCIRAERDFYYGERQVHRINDESLRSLVSELDMQEISMRKRLAVARRAAGLAPSDGEGGH